MNITRDNYEMLFLMYVDNELSSAEKKGVEIFAENNTDLSKELETLLLTRLSNDNDIFVPKTLLYRNATEVENVQESLLLHLDGELSENDIVTVDEQIRFNILVEEEWLILKKTKLQVDLITFPDKASLYRHEGRTIYMDWLKNVAAAITGVGMFFAAAMLFHKPDADSIAVNPPVIEHIIPGNRLQSINENIPDKSVAGSNKQIPAKTSTVKGRSVNLSLMPPLNAEQKAMLQKNKTENNNLAITPSVKPEEKPVMKEINQPLIKASGTESLALISKSEILGTRVSDTEITETKQQFAKLALHEDSHDRILYMDEDKLSRTKLAGIFRRVKRVVERNTKIKTANGFHIGGFEIAVK